jgi:hypothetical protein
VNPGTVNTDQHVNWLATAAGGNGNYNYSWTGTDGLNVNSSYVSKLYFTSGIKNGTETPGDTDVDLNFQTKITN